MATMLKVYGGGGEKPVPEKQAYTGKSRTSLDDTADVRDIISSLIARGVGKAQTTESADKIQHKSALGDENDQADYGRLRQLLGPEKAQKLMTSIFIHNQRNATLPMEKRIQTFYDVGSNDADVNEVIGNVRSFGYGVLPGFRESSKQSNQMLTGKIPSDMSAATSDADLQRRIMLRLNK
jgi:hypothetical protein